MRSDVPTGEHDSFDQNVLIRFSFLLYDSSRRNCIETGFVARVNDPRCQLVVRFVMFDYFVVQRISGFELWKATVSVVSIFTRNEALRLVFFGKLNSTEN